MNRHSPRTQQLIRQLHQAGLPFTEIARQVGIAPTTVWRIVHATDPPPRESPAQPGPDPPPDIDDDPTAVLALSAVRCPGCGGRVYHWPCLCCELRAKAQRRSA